MTYIQPIVPQIQESGTMLALCNKGAYGNISAELIIEWMETYRYLGVDKVVTYFLKDLNVAAKKVLLYYSDIGFVELYEFHPALEGKFKKLVYIGVSPISHIPGSKQRSNPYYFN